MKQPGIENLAQAGSTGQLPAPGITKKPFLRAEMAALLLVAGVLTVFQIVLVYNLTARFNSDPATDFNIFLKFARAVLDGQSPYQPYQPLQGAFQGELRFIYLYWVIFFYLPFARLETDLALHLWAVINLLLLFGAVWLGWRAYLPKWRGYWLLPLYCLALAVCSNAIMNGHTTVIMLLGLAASAYLYRQGKFFAAGLPALVLLIKPQVTFLAGAALLALVVYQLARFKGIYWKYNNWPPLLKWLSGAVVSTLVITAVSLAFEPDWPFRLAGAFNAQQINGQIQADGTYLEFYKSIFPSWLEFLTGWTQPWVALVSVQVMAGLVVWGSFRLWQWREDYPVFLGIGLALTLTVTTYSHVYDFPPLVLAVFIVLGQTGRDWRARGIRPVLLRSGALVLLFTLQPLSPDYRWFYSQPFVITLLVLTIAPEKPGAGKNLASNHHQPSEI